MARHALHHPHRAGRPVASAYGLSILPRLDQWFERRTRRQAGPTCRATPSLVSLLADSGVDLLHIGINPAAAAPDVPPLFRWNDPAGGEPPPEVDRRAPARRLRLAAGDLGDTGVVVRC